DPDDASQWQSEDVISRGYKGDAAFMARVADTRPVAQLDVDAFHAMGGAGGQGPMFTFADAKDLQTRFVEFYEAGKVTAALCHGVAILRYAFLSNGDPLVAGRTVTGFANIEEDFADEAVWSTGAMPQG